MVGKLVGTLGVAVALLAGTASAPLWAQEQDPSVDAPETEEAPGRITMNFQDVDISVLVKFISDITGKNFIVDEKVRGKVTIISPGKISVDEAYLVFQSVLQVKGFTTVPSGSIIKLVATKDAKTSTIDTIMPEGVALPSDEYITRLMRLKYVDAGNMVTILQPLASPDGLLTAYSPTNTLIIIDTAAQTDRLARILTQLDVEGQQQEIEVVRLSYAFAGDISALLKQLLEEPSDSAGGQPATQPGASPDARLRRGGATGAVGGAPGGTGAGAFSGGVTPERQFKIIPDERTNSLILVAGPQEARRIKDLISRLDVPLPLGSGRIHVYYLKYANAFELIPVLGSLVGGGMGMGMGMGGLGMMGMSPFGMGGMGGIRGGMGMGGMRGGMGGMGVGGMRGGMGMGGLGMGGMGMGGLGMGGFGMGGMGMGGFGMGGMGMGGMGMGGFGAAGSLTGRRTGMGGMGGMGMGGMGGMGMPGAPGMQQGDFEGIVRIGADPATNALIINASPQDFETMREVIEKLDVRRRQVYVEAIIAEVSVQVTRELGIELQGATSLPNGVGLGRTNLTGDINSLLTPVNLSGLVLAAASSQTVTVPGIGTIPAQQALLRALERRSDANILSAPTVLTTDNLPAEIVSGQNVPFIASRAANEVNLGNTFATVERRDVGITLRITPQISEGGQVRLDIFQEVSDLVSQDPQLGPTTTIRSAQTSVVTRDGQTVVIGGIMFDARTNDTGKVPFLGDIPVIGSFFRSDKMQNRKTNLLLFLTPTIIRNERDQRNVAVGERERVLRKPYEDMGQRAPQWDQIYSPSWEVRPSLEQPREEVAPAPSGGRARIDVYRPEGASAPRESELAVSPPSQRELAPAPVPEPERGLSGANHYVLLASLSEGGMAPSSLTSSNGLVALAVPADSVLSGSFRKGSTYRFEAPGFAANYLCLEVFISPAEAFALYPEGMKVSTQPPTYLHWREPTEPTILQPANWKAS